MKLNFIFVRGLSYTKQTFLQFFQGGKFIKKFDNRETLKISELLSNVQKTDKTRFYLTMRSQFDQKNPHVFP